MQHIFEDKNIFIENLLKDIIHNFCFSCKQVNSFMPGIAYDDNSVLFAGQTALYLTSKLYEKKSERIKDLTQVPIEIIISKLNYSLFLNCLRKYGFIRDIKTVLSPNNSVQDIKTFTFTLDMETDDSANGLGNILIRMFKKQYESVEINFRIITTKTNKYDGKDRLFVSDCLYVEYVPDLDLYIYSTMSEKLDNDKELSLFNVSLQHSLNNLETKSKLIDYDNKIAYEQELVINMIIEGKDMLRCSNLPYNEIKLEKEEICTICQEGVNIGFKTSCDHYFHNRCLGEFLNIYYTELADSVKNNEKHNLLYDIQGNIIKGAEYTWCCPNCKKPCFKLDIKREIINNPENCIYKLKTANQSKIDEKPLTEPLEKPLEEPLEDPSYRIPLNEDLANWQEMRDFGINNLIEDIDNDFENIENDIQDIENDIENLDNEIEEVD